jgi:uncharacterized membrane protein YesL
MGVGLIYVMEINAQIELSESVLLSQVIIIIIINCSTALLYGFGSFFSFLILYKIGKILWTGDQPFAVALSTHRPTGTE